MRRAGHSSRGVLPNVRVSECDREASTKRGGPGPYKVVDPYKKKTMLVHRVRVKNVVLYAPCVPNVIKCPRFLKTKWDPYACEYHVQC